jgi:polyisoprenoid-binding protein YceI
MLRLLIPVLLLVAAPALAAPEWRYAIDRQDSSLDARVRFFGLASKTAHFPAVSGRLGMTPGQPETMRLLVTVDATQLEAGDRLTLNRLKGPAFFDVESHPQVQFSGRGLRFVDALTAEVDGVLTVRGVSRPQTLVAQFETDPLAGDGRAPVPLAGEIVIDRRDYGMTAWQGIVGNRVTISIRGVLRPEVPMVQAAR